jgi:hypothetical protein
MITAVMPRRAASTRPVCFGRSLPRYMYRTPSASAAAERMTRNGVTNTMRYVEICNLHKIPSDVMTQMKTSVHSFRVLTYATLSSCSFRSPEDKSCPEEHLQGNKTVDGCVCQVNFSILMDNLHPSAESIIIIEITSRCENLSIVAKRCISEAQDSGS